MKEGGGGGEGSEQASVSFHSSLPPSLSFTRAIFRAVFGSRSSFFVPKPHGNACHASARCREVVIMER